MLHGGGYAVSKIFWHKEVSMEALTQPTTCTQATVILRVGSDAEVANGQNNVYNSKKASSKS